MNEHETELIRDYVHMDYLLKMASRDMEHIKVSHYYMSGFLQTLLRGIGSDIRNKQKEVKRELLNLKIHVWIEDDGGDIIYICTSKNMVKDKFGMKRQVLYEDMEHTLNRMIDNLLAEPPSKDKQRHPD